MDTTTAGLTTPTYSPPDPKTAGKALDIERDFNTLSLRDLLAARDMYHLHLMAKQHVIATAVGRYLIRKGDPWPTDIGELSKLDTAAKAKGRSEPRTLSDSQVRPYSWPCVLVFVDKWINPEDAAEGKIDPRELVPRTLYMPDGTRVPVCVVEAKPVDRPEYEPVSPAFPSQFIGGGYPIVTTVQGEEHFASVGCMVTDGHDVYAVTNRHVAGAPGEELFSVIGGERVRIGVSSDKQLTRKPFQEVYREWPGKDVFVNMDVALIRVDDKSKWTAQVYGTGEMGELADLSGNNFSLRLLDCPVRAFGAASGQLEGQILGLFYRYKSVGGAEYVSDFLIGPRQGDPPLQTRPGDSGTVWMLETVVNGNTVLRPLALQWGGHTLTIGVAGQQAPYALATCLSTVCNLLDVDVVRDWNAGMLDYWGAVGHYTIASLAVDRLTAGSKLQKLMKANLARISYRTIDIDKSTGKGLSTEDFVQLADVPDLVWKIGPYHRGGQTSPEHSNHFADMDRENSKGDTLIGLCKKDPHKYVTIKEWQAYYDEVKDKSRGLLPFRVQQFYEGMVSALSDKNDLKTFVCLAGVVSHYMGDSCQPLHISYRFNGNSDHMLPNPKYDPTKGPEHNAKEIPEGAGVHTAYEDTMINRHIGEIIKAARTDKTKLPTRPKTGGDAARLTVALMGATFDKINPSDIVKEYVHGQKKQLTPSPLADALWKKFGPNTIAVIEAGARHLAALWEGAWKEGGGDDILEGEPVTYKEADLATIYQPETFMPSRTLNTIGPLLEDPSTAG